MELIFTKTKRHSDTKNLSDNDKIEAIRSKNEYLTGKIYTLYRDEFIHSLSKQLKGEDDFIQDIYSEAFYTLCDKIYNNKLNDLSLTSTLKTYLFGIGKYMLMAHERKKKSSSMVFLPEIPDFKDDDSDFIRENEAIVQIVINNMGEPCYSLFVMKYWEDKSGEEIAAKLNYKNADTVKNQRYRCMEKLRSNLKGKINHN